ncbi:MAG: hypothetical protein Greene041679_181 [Parcubacteria group bacterium Greene0416_79]|nr:MAG: hypothetical protein Greene041679_181 [Parcubacteria group bacterium Greene0416_79]
MTMQEEASRTFRLVKYDADDIFFFERMENTLTSLRELQPFLSTLPKEVYIRVKEGFVLWRDGEWRFESGIDPDMYYAALRRRY